MPWTPIFMRPDFYVFKFVRLKDGFYLFHSVLLTYICVLST